MAIRFSRLGRCGTIRASRRSRSLDCARDDNFVECRLLNPFLSLYNLTIPAEVRKYEGSNSSRIQ